MRGTSWLVWAAAGVVAVAVFVIGALRPFAAPPSADQRMLAIAAQLRCPVCGGQSAADADTSEAEAMRQQIAADLQSGMTQRQILDQFVGQYGVWILYRPPARGALALLWALPAVAVAGAGVAIGVQSAVRQRRAAEGAAGDAPSAALDRTAEPDPEVVRRLGRFL